MPGPAQTPGTWLRGGAGSKWSAECRAALIACGINPDDFGTYDERAKAQSAARKDFQDRRIKEMGGASEPHPSPCKYDPAKNSLTCTCYQTADALKREGGQNWLYLNSQSGHLSRNTFYQGTGKRADPCSNVRPSKSADGSLNSGGYGYRDNDAFCMDHTGLRCGQEHYWICRTEQAHATSMGTDAPVPMAQLEKGVEMSAQVVVDRGNAVKGVPPDVDVPVKGGKDVAAQADRAALIDKAREDVRQKQEAAAAGDGKVGDVAGAKSGSPNGPANAGASAAEKKKAVECIKDAWKESLGEMQATAVTEHSTASKLERKEVADFNAKNPDKKVSNFDEIPEPHKGAAQQRVDAGVDARQKELAGKGAENAGETRDPHPTADECLEYQGNWLYQHQKDDGSFPPMQGSTGSGPPPTTTKTNNDNDAAEE